MNNRIFAESGKTTSFLIVFIGVILISFLAHPCYSAPLNGEVSSFKQPDGTNIVLKFYGDEFYARTETVHGYTVIFDKNQKAYYYATLSADGNNFISTGKRVGKIDPKTIGLEKSIRINQIARNTQAKWNYNTYDAVVKQSERWKSVKEASTKLRALKKIVKELKAQGKKSFAIPLGTILPDQPTQPALDISNEDGPAFAPPALSGDVVGLTILVDFSDDPGSAVTQAEVDAYCNQPNFNGWGNKGSIFDFFYAQSATKLRYTNNVTYYVRVPQPKTYYNDTSVGAGTCGRLLLNDALDVLIADGYDFSPLSVNSYSRIRACNIFFAGNNSGVWSAGLWPHRWVLSSPKSVGGGKAVYDYQITNIGSSGNLVIGTFCHENGHMLLGYDDYYDYNGDSRGLGKYTLMANSGSTYPANIHGYLKFHSGWLDAIELNGATTPQRCSARVDSDTIYTYTNGSDSAEYFMIENRALIGWEQGSALPDAGLMITHNDENGDRDSQEMTEAQHYECSLEQADGDFDLENNIGYGDNTDLFHTGGTGAATTFSDTTLPNAKWWAGANGSASSGTNSGLNIHSISTSGESMTFIYGAGTPSGLPTIGVDASTIEARCDYGDNAPSDTFAVFNAGGQTLSYTISDNQSWLSCTPASGTATTESDQITMNFSTGGLSSGTYSATITVAASGATNSSETLTVNLIVASPATISLSPGSISESVAAGNSLSSFFNITNPGGGSLDYSVSSSESWLQLSSNSGTVMNETDRINLILDATALTSSTYNGTITVTSSDAANSPVTLNVTFTVTGGANCLVTYPTGGEKLYKTLEYEINWTTSASVTGNVKLELYKNGSLNSTLAANTANDGVFNWTLSGAQASGNDYKIKITSINEPSISGESAETFEIVPVPTLATLPYSESYESGLGLWVQSTDDDYNWTRQTGKGVLRAMSENNNTGPASAQNGSWYMYIDNYDGGGGVPAGYVSNLECVFDFQSATAPEMTFWYHMYGEKNFGMGTLEVEASIDNQNFDTVFTKTGNQGDQWLQATVDLSAYVGEIVFIRIVGTIGPSWDSDMAIDNIAIVDNTATPNIVTNTNSVTVPEGNSATFQVKLSSQPAATTSVNVARYSGDSDISVSGGASLSFTTSNWNSYQTVTLTASEDGDTTNGSATIRCSASGLSNKDIAAAESDNDTPAVGVLEFSSATYAVDEDGSSITIAVHRIGGSEGGVSVDYATSNNSATAGSDYAATSGTLNWSPGNSNPKSFTVSILDDSVYEGDETVTITLSNPSGITISGPNTATLTIIEDDINVDPPHSADTNSDWSISVSEVNSFIGLYHNNDNIIATANGDITSGRITMRETLRVIYLYNGGGAYKVEGGTVDGYDVDGAQSDSDSSAPPELEQGNTITVANSANSGAGSFRNAIANVAHGDTITFDASLEKIILVSEIVIDKSITIDGNGVSIVSGDAKTRIFRIYNEDEDLFVLLLNMGIVDGKNSADEFGGAIYNNGENLTLENCLFNRNSNNVAGGRGGAIYTSGSLTVNNCEFIDNSASEDNDIYSTNEEVVH